MHLYSTYTAIMYLRNLNNCDVADLGTRIF